MQTVNPIRVGVYYEGHKRVLFDDYIDASTIPEFFYRLNADQITFPNACEIVLVKSPARDQESVLEGILLLILKHFPERFEECSIVFNMEDQGCVNARYSFDRIENTFDSCQITNPDIFDQAMFKHVKTIQMSGKLNSEEGMMETEKTICQSKHLNLKSSECNKGYITCFTVEYQE